MMARPLTGPRSAADKETKKTPMDEGSQREDNVQ